MLSAADRYEEALLIATDGLAAAQRDQQGWAYQMFETWYGRMLPRTWRLSEALAVLEGRFAAEDGSRAAAVLDAAGIVALGRLAIHTGDARQARRLARSRTSCSNGAHPRCDATRIGCSRSLPWPKATPTQRELASRTQRSRRPADPAAVPARHRRRGFARAHRAARQRTTSSPNSARQQPRRAELDPASPRSRRRRRMFAVFSSQATRTSVKRSISSRAHRDDSSSGRHSKTWAVNWSRPTAKPPIEVLGRSLALYTELGATWDARRVRSRLRELGVRRRIVTAELETTRLDGVDDFRARPSCGLLPAVSPTARLPTAFSSRRTR